MIKKIKQLKISPQIACWFSKEMPLVSESEMMAGDYHNGDYTRRCLIGHQQIYMWSIDIPLTEDQNNVANKISDAILISANKILKANYHTISQANDIGCSLAAQNMKCSANVLRAKIWNLAVALLGYTEGNPEAKYVK